MAGGGFGGGRGNKKRRTLEMQLTTLVDIFVIIVIFMVSGMVIGASDLTVPGELKPPMSFGREQLESAPSVVITDKDVTVSQLGDTTQKLQPVELAKFKNPPGASTPEVDQLKAYLKAYIDGLAPDRKVAGSMLNIVADRETPYADIFDAMRPFREAGFETMLFIAAGDVIPESLKTSMAQPLALPAGGAAPQPQTQQQGGQ